MSDNIREVNDTLGPVEVPDIRDTKGSDGIHSQMARRTFLRRAGGLTAGVLASTLSSDALAADRASSRPAPTTSEQDASEHPAVVSDTSIKARRNTLFCIGYETWFVPKTAPGHWTTAEAKPKLGYYSSLDRKVIRQHASWLHNAGFDFIFIDWTNNLGGNWHNGVAKNIINATMVLLDEYSRLPKCPKFAILLGLDNGSITTKPFKQQLAMVEKDILGNPKYAALWQKFEGKPLLSIYPLPASIKERSYQNPKFTVRLMDGYHDIVLDRWGSWGWLDRKPIINGPIRPIHPFENRHLAPWKAGPGWSLGKTRWVGKYARHARGASSSLISPPFTIEDRILSFDRSGIDYMPYARLKFANNVIPPHQTVFVLRDAANKHILRKAFPPGTPQFAMCQWDVSDLLGRQVVFEAKSGSAAGTPYGGDIGFGGLGFTSNEQLVAAVGACGNEAGCGSWFDWDAQGRRSGATLTHFMNAAFRYEPAVVMVQQWNEFAAPDQYGVEGSNDIEPTTISRLAGPYSDGWGDYYLDLVRTMIQQYRQGLRIPQVMLDTRYP